MNNATKGLVPFVCVVHFAALYACEATLRPVTVAAPSGIRVATVETPRQLMLTRDRAEGCPDGMKRVRGSYCPQVEQVCLEWVDAVGKPTNAPASGQTGRCGTFQQPSKCLTPEAKRPFKDFCIDTYEIPNVRGQVPQSWMTWHDVKNVCESQGKRLPTRSEWTFACEGPDIHPYPYGDGFHRDRTSCNTDNSANGIDVFKATSHDTETARRLDGLLTPSGSKPLCVSPFGVYDQVGNVDEQVVNETGQPYKSGLMGGHVFGVRNYCRPMTEAHGELFSWYETSGRCVSDVKP